MESDSALLDLPAYLGLQGYFPLHLLFVFNCFLLSELALLFLILPLLRVSITVGEGLPEVLGLLHEFQVLFLSLPRGQLKLLRIKRLVVFILTARVVFKRSGFCELGLALEVGKGRDGGCYDSSQDIKLLLIAD